MDNIKMRLTNAVASQLSAAPHSVAKSELIEELSDNLYQRYQDLTAAGTPPEEAYRQALDCLGTPTSWWSTSTACTPTRPCPSWCSAPTRGTAGSWRTC